MTREEKEGQIIWRTGWSQEYLDRCNDDEIERLYKERVEGE